MLKQRSCSPKTPQAQKMLPAEYQKKNLHFLKKNLHFLV